MSPNQTFLILTHHLFKDLLEAQLLLQLLYELIDVYWYYHCPLQMKTGNWIYHIYHYIVFNSELSQLLLASVCVHPRVFIWNIYLRFSYAIGERLHFSSLGWVFICLFFPHAFMQSRCSCANLCLGLHKVTRKLAFRSTLDLASLNGTHCIICVWVQYVLHMK